MAQIKHWLFDLDDTLYPASCGLFKQVSIRITTCIGETLGLSTDDARALQHEYWRRYGTSLRGLILHHGVDPEPFLAYVHDVPVETYLCADVELRAMLQRLEGRRHVFTNSPSEYAARVLQALDVADLFDNVFDIRHAQLRPKPDPHAYERVLDTLGDTAERCLFVDDAPHNLEAARERGMVTVWLRSPHSVAGGQAGGSVELHAQTQHRHLVIDTLQELEAVVSRHFRRPSA